MPDANKNFQFFLFTSYFNYGFLGVSLLHLPSPHNFYKISVRVIFMVVC